MLEHLRGKASDRKLRLFACACVRRVWHLLDDRRSQAAVEACEDHPGGDVDLLSIGEAALQAAHELNAVVRRDMSAMALRARALAATAAANVLGRGVLFRLTSAHSVASGASWAVAVAAKYAARAGGASGLSGARPERKAQSDLLRDVFRTPFRSAIAIDTTRLVRDDFIARIAASVYTARDFDRLSLLADALEDAGCTEAELLGHLRGPGPHVRGCWALDLVLGAS
jgi:hypothetical protein